MKFDFFCTVGHSPSWTEGPPCLIHTTPDLPQKDTLWGDGPQDHLIKSDFFALRVTLPEGHSAANTRNTKQFNPNLPTECPSGAGLELCAKTRWSLGPAPGVTHCAKKIRSNKVVLWSTSPQSAPLGQVWSYVVPWSSSGVTHCAKKNQIL